MEKVEMHEIKVLYLPFKLMHMAIWQKKHQRGVFLKKVFKC